MTRSIKCFGCQGQWEPAGRESRQARLCPECRTHMKWCAGVGRDGHAFESSRPGRLSRICPPCQKRYSQGYYLRNPEAAKRRAGRRAIELRERVGAMKVAAGCADCGYNKHHVALDFDHLPGHEKLFGIGTDLTRRPWHEVEAEIAKCDIVCANCHRIRTWARGQHDKNYDPNTPFEGYGQVTRFTAA